MARTARPIQSARLAAILLSLAAALPPLLCAAAPKRAQPPPWKPPAPTRVASGLHDGPLSAPRIRPDGEWIAYAASDPRPDGSTRIRFFARSLVEDGVFRAIWPDQHPSLVQGQEGTASFTDMLDFRWHPEGRHSAMVARHRSAGDEVMLEMLGIRFGGPGNQDQPAFSADGAIVAVVADAELGREIWIAEVKHEASLEQITWTHDAERWPVFHPTERKILHEIRNLDTGRSDLFVFDLDAWEQVPLLRLEPSDEIRPSWSPDGGSVAFLSDKDDPSGRRYDLFVAGRGGQAPRRLVQGVRTTEGSPGYAWGPAGRWIVCVLDRAPDFPLVVVPADGSGAAKVLDFGTRDNRDPDLAIVDGKVRLAWAADDEPGRPFPIVYVADVGDRDLAAFARSPAP